MTAIVLHEPAQAVTELHRVGEKYLGDLTLERNHHLSTMHLAHVFRRDQPFALIGSIAELKRDPLGHITRTRIDRARRPHAIDIAPGNRFHRTVWILFVRS